MSSGAVQQEIADAVALHRRGELTEAAQRYQSLLTRFPESADLLNLLGALQLAQGNRTAALQSLSKASELKPGHAVIACNLGLAYKSLGRMDEARDALIRATELDSALIDAWMALASVYKLCGDLDAALKALDQAITCHGRHAAAHCNRGNVLQALRQWDAARAAYEVALQLDDSLVEARIGYANCLTGEERLLEAIAHFERLAQRWPNEVAVWQGLGNAYLRSDRLEDAAASLTKALEYAPNQLESLVSLGVAFKRLGDFDKAERSYIQALRVSPQAVNPRFNLALLYQEQRLWSQALEAFDQVIELNPDHADAHFNRGVLLRWLKRYSEAADAFTESIRLRPDHAESHYNRAINWLTQGDFERGWAEYEWRWELEHIKSSKRPFDQPLWLGQGAIEGKTILLHAEQGLGDTIQFCRFAAAVKAMGARVVMEVQPALYRLLTTLDGVDELVIRGSLLPHFDLHCPLMSLPLALGLTVNSISGEPYLRADHELVERWNQRLGPRRGERVGLVWSGNPSYSGDAERSLSFEAMSALLEAGVDYVCLQQTLRSGETPDMLGRRGVRFFGDQLKDFADTAALTACMDRVISVDTSVLHLAGALGVPAQAILPEVSDFRWIGGGPTSVWYRSLGLRTIPQAG